MLKESNGCHKIDDVLVFITNENCCVWFQNYNISKEKARVLMNYVFMLTFRYQQRYSKEQQHRGVSHVEYLPDMSAMN